MHRLTQQTKMHLKDVLLQSLALFKELKDNVSSEIWV